MTDPRRALDRALLELSRYEINQLGHRDARRLAVTAIEALIDERIAKGIEAALAAAKQEEKR